ncbi:MAG TPA: DUF6622 family protein, partial [Ideonella sp.]|nr:DUF6622 family protein [Ideonella sp.]
AALAARAGPPAGARWLPAERAWALPGSWAPLALMLGLFALRFVVAALLATHAGLRDDLAFAALAGAGYGALSGVFLGRAMALWRLASAAQAPA